MIVDFAISLLLSFTTLWVVWTTPPAHQVAVAASLLVVDIAYYYFRLSSDLGSRG
jgi:hypothetical protein